MLTLAQMYAAGAFLRPEQVGRLAPVLALIPLYALRNGVPIESVWAMPAGAAVRALVDMLPDVITPAVQAEFPAVEAELRDALDPARIAMAMQDRSA